ncbi:MAG: hypothetical protein DRP42_06735 [Tenericutes bacterium]|nr:MAG: hypothetical protein DRP42_06735 [Mycoplasmatota bacterium]
MADKFDLGNLCNDLNNAWKSHEPKQYIPPASSSSRLDSTPQRSRLETRVNNQPLPQKEESYTEIRDRVFRELDIEYTSENIAMYNQGIGDSAERTNQQFEELRYQIARDNTPELEKTKEQIEEEIKRGEHKLIMNGSGGAMPSWYKDMPSNQPVYPFHNASCITR